MTQRRACYFSGRVQGIGFRYTAHNIALQHNVNGYVRNLPDGRVEMVVEGPDSEIDEVLTSLQGRLNGFIRHVDQEMQSPTGEYNQFYIKH